MPYFLVLNQMASTTAGPAFNPKGETRNMEIRIKGLVRRQLVYGFEAEKDGEGEIIGSSVVKLARRNAFELVGLKRPALAPAWRWKMG
jgi:hypothetical protein